MPLGSAQRVRHAPRLDQLVPAALEMLEERFTEYPDTYVLFSGGKDSVTCLDLARQVNPTVKVAMFDSGMEFRQVREYVDRIVARWNLDLHIFPAEPSALDVMAASGQWEHGVPKVEKDDLHSACITRPLASAREALGMSAIYGLRADEAPERRIMLAKTQGRVTNHDRKGVLTQVYLAPIWRWSSPEVHSYLANRQIPLNPIYRELMKRGVPERRARVGLLVDGWGLDQGRWALAMAIDPDLARTVEARLPALAEFR